MKLPKIKKPASPFFLILFLAIIAGALVTWQVFLAPRRRSQSSTTSAITTTPIPESKFPSPSPQTSKEEGRGDSPEELTQSLKERFPLIESVPYETESFSIDYKAPLHLEVKIKIATEESKIREEVSDWLWSKSVNPFTHQIDWITP